MLLIFFGTPKSKNYKPMMKTKTGFIFLFTFLFSLNLFAQDYEILGPTSVCVGDCADYMLVDGGGNIIDLNGGYWGVDGQIVSTETIAVICFADENPHFIYVIDIDGEQIAELFVEAILSFQPEIIALSAAYCPVDSMPGGSNSCDQVCANTTINYTTEINNPGQSVIWSVSGAESYTVDGSNVSVTWGAPGNGQVSVQVSPPGNIGFSISCGMYLEASNGGSDGGGFVYIDGPSDTYDIEVVGPNNYNAIISNGGSINIFDGLEAGTYTATVTNSNGMVESCSFTISDSGTACSIGVALDVDDASDCQVCDASITAVTIAGNGPFSYGWSTGNTTPSIHDLCPGVYTLTISDDEGCTATVSAEVGCDVGSCWGGNSICVDIIANPEAAFETTPPANNGVIEICEGQTVFFENLTTGASTFTWDFGNATSSSEVDAEYTYLSSGTYEVMLIARNDCFCSDTTFITVIVEDAISPEIDCAGTICIDTEVTYSTAGDCSIFNWNISSNGTIISGGGISDNYITVDWGTGPEGLIELSVDGCNGDYCLETMFETIPIIDDNAIIKGPDKVCKSAEAIYSITSYTGTEFNWTVSSYGSIESGQGTNEITVAWPEFIPIIQQWVAVDYESCYLGCGGGDTLLVNILEDFYVEGPIEICMNETVDFFSKTPGIFSNPVSSNWTIFDNNNSVVSTSVGATDNFNVNWTFGSGNFTIYAEADNPDDYCVDNYSVFVEVPAMTPPALGISGPATICPGESYSYSAIESGPGFQYTWYVSNGASNIILNGQTINITWAASLPYNLAVTQTNTSGLACESADVGMGLQSINSVTVDGTGEVCHEEIGTYTATSYESVDHAWQTIPNDAGTVISGENTETVEIQWHLAGNFDVQVNVCGITDVFNVLVNPKPVPQVVFDDPCPGELTLVQTTIGYSAYEWLSEGGGTIATTPTVDLGTGYYELIVTDANGCTENETFYIGELPNPYTTISTPDFGTFCQNGGSMTLYSLQSSGGLDYQWFHDGNPIGANASSIVVTQEGVYYVVVTNPEGCEATSNALGLSCGSVFPGPPAPGCTPGGYLDFVNNPGNFCNESQYLNTSVNDVPNSWFWRFIDFGAGSEIFSTLENPNNTYQTAGFHLVIFQAGVYSTPPGDICDLYIYQFDTVPLAANFGFLEGCVGDLLPFYDLSSYIPQTSIAGWEWDFDDPASGASNSSVLQNPQHAFTAGGTYTVTLTVTDQSGCVSVMQRNVEVLEPPLSSFTIPSEGCEGATIFFEAAGPFSDVNWDFGDPASGAANISEIGDTYHEFEAPGIYTVTLTTENIYGCVAIVTEQIDIQPNMLSGSIDIDPASTICEGDSSTLTAPLADSYLWSIGDTTASITVLEAGIYEVTIYDALGCSYSPSAAQIDVIPLPQAQITAVEYDEFGQPVANFYNNYESCYGENVHLEITENINYTYEWSTTDITTDISFTEEKDNLLAVGTHDFTVTVTDVNSGCTNVIGPFTVTIHPIPENIMITSNPTIPICENTPTVFEVVNPDANYTYVWNTGEVGVSINSFYAGEYFVRAINEFGCEGASNSLEISAGPNIDLIPSGCHSRCNPDTICLPIVPGVINFQWYFNGNPIAAPDGTVADFIATESGEYYVEMTSAEGCVTISDELSLDLFDGFGSILGNVYFDMNDNGIIDGGDTLMSGISIILQDTGINLDTIDTNLLGAFAFSNILASNYEVLVDILNLPFGMTPVFEQFSSSLVGCDDEGMVEFLIQFVCDATVDVVQLEACEGTTIPYNGDDLSPGTTTNYTYTNSFGCDSIISVEVNEIFSSSFNLELSACDGDSATYNGTPISTGMSQDFIFPAANGCDSTVTVEVVPILLVSEEIDLAACEGTTIKYNGEELTPGSVTEFTFISSLGCDSMVTVNVGTLFNTSSNLGLSACENGTVPYNGQNLEPGSVSMHTFANEAGCDSLVTVTVASIPVDETFIDLFACVDETVEYNNDQLVPGTQIDYTFINQEGCDSVVHVNVLAYPDFSYDLLPFESCWNATEGEIIVEYLVGGTAPFEYSLDGVIYQPENNFMNISAGDYEVFVKDDNGCVNTQMVTVESISPMNIVAEDPLLDCEFGSALLQPQVIADDPQEVSYLWPDGSTAPFYQVDSSGIYTVAISNTCETIDFDYNVEYKDDERSSLIFIPNVFSPNGDGVNDEFRVYVANEVQVLFFELNIFDRWGNHLTSFQTTEDFWDGKLNNSFMNPGVFVYYYKATIVACGQKVDLFRKGDMTLVK